MKIWRCGGIRFDICVVVFLMLMLSSQYHVFGCEANAIRRSFGMNLIVMNMFDLFSLWECFAGMAFIMQTSTICFSLWRLLSLWKVVHYGNMFAVMVFQYGDNGKARLALLAQAIS